jgi:methylisocitrate lyase
MRDVESKRAAFRTLHESGCFVIPNPWDLGSALHLARLGFRALATTSAGFAWSRGKADNHVTIDEALRHYEEIAAAVDVPLNADFEGGYAVEPAAVGAHVRRAIATGISGISLEDSTGDERAPLFEFDLAVDRVRAAAEAVRGSGVILTARTEGFLVGRPDLPETVRRLEAFAAAGADCLYAPGIRSAEQITTVVQAIAPKPVNVLVGGPFATVAMLETLGVRRISVGGALARAAWRGFLAAAMEIAHDGTFHALGEAAPFGLVNGLFERSPR